jgi:flagellar biosynthetic protein FliS
MLRTGQPEVSRYYADWQVRTASQPRAICMLHERCIALVAAAGRHGADRRPLLDKAQNILAQLESALRLDEGDRLTQSLFYLYDYAYLLLERGADEDREDVMEIMRPLRNSMMQAWRRMG